MKKLLALLNKPIPHTPKAGVLLVIGLLVFAVSCFATRFVSGFMPLLNFVGDPSLEGCTGEGSALPSPWASWSGGGGVCRSTGHTGSYGAHQATGVYGDYFGQVLALDYVSHTVSFWASIDTGGNPGNAWVDLTLERNSPPYDRYVVCSFYLNSIQQWDEYVCGFFPPDASTWRTGFLGRPGYIPWMVDDFCVDLAGGCGATPPTSTPPPLSGCLAPPDGGFDAVPITSTWFCTTELGQTEHSLFVEPDGITDNTLYWLQDMRFNYPVGEGCYRAGTAGTFQITQTGWYTFTLDYSLVPGIEGIHALWTTAGLIANFPGGPNGPESQFWTGRLVALDGVTTTITGSQYFSQTGPYNLFFQFIPRRDPFLDGPGTDVIYVDNACIRNQPDATPTPTVTPTPTNTPTPTPTGTITATETSTPTPTPTSWAGPPPTATPTVPGGTPGPTATPQPPQQAGFCDSTTAPTFPPDDGSCGPDVSFLSDPVGWVRQQICRLVGLFPRSFTWMGWFLEWLFCPILDVIGGLLCALAVVVPMIQSFLNMVTWIWNFIIAAFTAFNFEKNKPVTVFTDFMGGWVWIELTDVIAKLKGTTFFGWLFDWFIRALLWWNTFIWFMTITASGAGESSTEAQDSGGE